MQLTPEERTKQEHYRDARFNDKYDDIWQSVGKCVFCDLRDKYIFFEENGVVMTVSLFAYIDGHFMIVPRRHVRSSKELTQLEWDTVRKFTYIAKKLIKDVHDVKGMQLVQKDGSSAQSTVDQHLHFHCIPFDAPDLSIWNYRRLTHTPIESAAMYRKAGKKIIKTGGKFDKKYAQPEGLPIIVDAVLINDRNEVLLEKRTTDASMEPPHDTLPGGHVENFDTRLEDELVRELAEETGLDISADSVRLVASRVGSGLYKQRSQHLGMEYIQEKRYLWNTYVRTGIPHTVRLTPGDDADSLYWQPIAEALESASLTPALQQAIREAAGHA